ncbi:MAG UNVERIFIED_CONTAM: hypothetical protein LVR29_19770 [Microcystis novacekii LVE1205-3]
MIEEIVRRLKSDQAVGRVWSDSYCPRILLPIFPMILTRRAALWFFVPIESHGKSAEDSPARRLVAEILNQRGGSPRYYKNTLVFVAA